MTENRLTHGLLVGVVTPLICWIIIYGTSQLLGATVDPDSGSMLSLRSERTYALVAICANIFWIRKFNQRLTQQTLRGVIIITMLFCLSWVIRYYSSLY